MTHLKSLCVAAAVAGLVGCATESADVKLGTKSHSEPSVIPNADLLNLQLRIGDLENQLEVKNQHIAELTELVVAAELARTDHLVAESDGE